MAAVRGVGPLVAVRRELLPDARHQARPQVRVQVVPRVEVDLDDLFAERVLAAVLSRLSGARLDPVYLLAHEPHEETLAAPPRSEQADRERRMDRFGADHGA